MHSHGKPTYQLLLGAIVVTLLFACIEAVSGWWAHSLTLLGDAGHMVADSLALGISALAAWIALKPPTSKHSYGLGRAEVIAAWASSLFMMMLCIVIIYEAIERLETPHPVKGVPVIIVGFIGLVLNLGVAFLLNRGEKTLNIRAALLHVISDALGSFAALMSGLIIYYTHWLLIDPLLSIFIALLILISSIQLLRESMTVLMEGVPKHLNITEVSQTLSSLPQVRSIHDLHIWTLSSGQIMLTAHIDIDNLIVWDKILPELIALLHEKYHIEHVTLQPEPLEKSIQFMERHKLCEPGDH